jgi:hypothetical protein
MYDRSHNHATRQQDLASVAIRLVDADRDGALARVAARDSAELPPAPWLVAEVEGEALAALSVANGELVADPFSRTAELGALLELRALQLRGRAGRRRRERGHRAPTRPRGGSRTALPSSPPGAGGRLLTLLPRF